MFFHLDFYFIKKSDQGKKNNSLYLKHNLGCCKIKRFEKSRDYYWILFICGLVTCCKNNNMNLSNNDQWRLQYNIWNMEKVFMPFE